MYASRYWPFVSALVMISHLNPAVYYTLAMILVITDAIDGHATSHLTSSQMAVRRLA